MLVYSPKMVVSFNLIKNLKTLIFYLTFSRIMISYGYVIGYLIGGTKVVLGISRISSFESASSTQQSAQTDVGFASSRAPPKSLSQASSQINKRAPPNRSNQKSTLRLKT
jgi:hypothetical protein